MKRVISKLVTLAFIVSILSTGQAFAEESMTAVEPTLNVNFSENKFNITGVSGKNDNYVLEILVGDIAHEAADDTMAKEDVSVDAILTNGLNTTIQANKLDVDSKLAYLKYFTTEDSGNFDVNAKITDTNTYSVYLKNLTTGTVKAWRPVNFTDFDDYSGVISLLNGKISNKTEFTALFTDANMKKLGFENPLNVNTAKAAELYFDELGGSSISASEYEENTELWDECSAIVALNSGNCDNIVAYVDGIVAESSTIKKWYDNYIKTETDEKALTSGMKNKSITDVEDLEKKLVEAIILKVVATPNGYLNIQSIMDDFKTTLGLTSISQNATVYILLAGNTYSSISALMAAYNGLVSGNGNGGNGNGGNGNGGNGGTGGGNGGYSGVTISGTGTSGSTQTPLTPINKDIFTDIENVSWAKEAIVNLKLKGVINGKTDTTFSPNDKVTREEFTKMITAAVAFNAEKAEIGFNDADPAMWYYTYLQQAKAAGIINGISDTYFGVGQPITRQDMAVIIYNAAKYKAVIGNATPDDFPLGDDASISDYAKEAVYTLKTMGIVNGVDSVNFAPLANATRAEAAVMIYRLLLK